MEIYTAAQLEIFTELDSVAKHSFLYFDQVSFYQGF